MAQAALPAADQQVSRRSQLKNCRRKQFPWDMQHQLLYGAISLLKNRDKDDANGCRIDSTATQRGSFDAQ
jgi:hypothetical protein